MLSPKQPSEKSNDCTNYSSYETEDGSKKISYKTKDRSQYAKHNITS
jgi:hypothetical protein